MCIRNSLINWKKENQRREACILKQIYESFSCCCSLSEQKIPHTENAIFCFQLTAVHTLAASYLEKNTTQTEYYIITVISTAFIRYPNLVSSCIGVSVSVCASGAVTIQTILCDMMDIILAAWRNYFVQYEISKRSIWNIISVMFLMQCKI